MNLKNDFTWTEVGEKEDGYYFVLADTCHHCDYSVILFKDDGRITINGDKFDNCPRNIIDFIKPRLDYFKTIKKLTNK